MSKGQAKRLTKQHISSGGVSGIFGEEAQVHDQSVGCASTSVFEELKREYPRYQFRFRQAISKQEINEKLNSIDKRLGKTLFVKESKIKPDGGIIEVQDKDKRWRVVLVSEAKFQGKDVENIKAGVLVGKKKDQELMVAGNAIERVYKNINEIRNFMLDEYHFPYAVFLQGSNFATETVQVFKPDGSFVEIRHDSGAMNRIDRVTAANYCMKINCNYCKNFFIGHKNSSIMLQAASIYARCEPWKEDEMRKIMMDIANTSIGILNQLG
ncbi:EcoRI family type II restriction endonuclease [Synechococcus sp. PCC 6312]|uniref:EcoRI family type II restriction endonuclease n=1 Tax=Synechococcus sp. (strain ATCC 27167 / PCC 6312) TaxID=195253 RepID=UPI00029EE369|nr:EcoRI family type II restriction endonuclease [Synechococcus sp. PCC 6312]AFY60063.1 Restriction endonuclease EcoRI [Synechococcus sp. PCC 6312]